MTRSHEDFFEILEQLYDQLLDSGAPLFPDAYQALRQAAGQLLQQTDMRFIPGYRLTELMADLVNVAATISAEGWRSNEEAADAFATLTAPESPLGQQFLIDAAMEKARYEPIMLAHNSASPLQERNALLRVRTKRMLCARQLYNPLPPPYLRVIRTTAHKAMEAECFARYRSGPMLQMVADMIRLADQIAEKTDDVLSGLAMLQELLSENGRLWKLYRGKSSRFAVDEDDPLHINAFPSMRAHILFIPDAPGEQPTLH